MLQQYQFSQILPSRRGLHSNAIARGETPALKSAAVVMHPLPRGTRTTRQKNNTPS